MSDKSQPQITPGAHSLAEILSQPQCWTACLDELQQNGVFEEIRRRYGKTGVGVASKEWIFIGCGSSYYIALSAAVTWTKLTGLRARAVPASEVLLDPDLIFAASPEVVPVLISRSGRTSEVLRAAELIEKRNIRTVAVTCAANQPLTQLASTTMLLPADEQSTVMTRSFTSMLLSLQCLAASMAGNQAFVESLRNMASAAAQPLAEIHPRLRDFVNSRPFADYICLGQGALYGLACESALKLTEMSVSYAQSFHTLEFRHGPKSIVSPETLLVFLLSETGYDAECEVLEEVKRLGGTTIAVTNHADSRVRAASDLVVEFKFDLPELTRLAPHLFAGQLLGLYSGLKKGLDPDNPRNLSRVVVLEEEASSEKQHASL